MKKRIIIAFTSVIVILLGLIACSFLSSPASTMVFAGLGCIALGAVIASTFLWLKFTEELTVRTGDNKKSAYLFSFDNIRQLQENISILQKKYHLAAQYLRSLVHQKGNEDLDPMLKHDSIGEAIQEMHSEMHKLKEEVEKRHWIAQGLAQFSGIHSDADSKSYATKIINSLIQYLGAYRGAFFIVNDEGEEPYLTPLAFYAYDKIDYKNFKVFEGQGVLGQCMLDKQIVNLTNVPSDYLKISSVSGEAKPACVVLLPLVYQAKFYGVIEVALFTVLLTHQMEFLEKVSENIAAEIAAIKIQQHTQALLEQSERLAHEVKEREKELKSNLIELTSAQEEMIKHQNELSSYLTAIDNTIACAQFDLQGNFVTGNDIFLRVMEYAKEELVGNNYKDIMMDEASTNMMWENIKVGKFFSGDFRMKNKTGKALWLNGTFNPINNVQGVPEKVMMFAQFITKEKERIHDLTIMVNALKATLPVLELNDQFVCKSANEKFLKISNCTRMNIKTKSICNFIDPSYRTVFESMQDEILASEFTSLILPVMLGDQKFIYETTVSIVRDLEGKISRIIMILVREVESNVGVLQAV